MEGGSAADVVILRRVYPLRNAGLAVCATGAVIAASVSGDWRVLLLVGMLFTGGVMTLFGISGTPRRVDARVDVEGLHVAGRLVASRRLFRSAWIERDPEGTCVHLHGPWPAIRLAANDEADAHRLVRLLGLDRSQSVLSFPVRVGWIWIWAVQQPLVWCFQGWELRSLSFAMLGVSVFCLAVLAWFLRRDEVIVGADGVLFVRPLRRKFVSFMEIESVRCEHGARLVVLMRGGATISRWMPASAASAAHDAIASTLASMATASMAGQVESARRQLRRDANDDDAAGWLARLRTLAQPESYRAPGLAADLLWRVIDDPGARGSERAAAAVLLGATATPEERRRLQDAAARIASPRVRVAIERVAAEPAVRSVPSTSEERRPVEGGESEDDELLAAMAAIVDAPR